MNSQENYLKCFENSCQNIQKVTVYHYTKIDNWRSIQIGSYKSKNVPGLGASRRMGKEDRLAFETGATFALLEPMPGSWVKNKELPITWDVLVSIIGPMLLEVEIYPEVDKVFIIDYGHMDGFQYEEKEGISDRYLHKTRLQAEKAYMRSMIPIKEYLQKRNQIDYSLPMVVILEDTPIDRIKISKVQPLLKMKLDYERIIPSFYNRIVDDIKRIPELNDWYEGVYKKSKMDNLIEINV